MSKKIVALIPLRGGSKSIPHKNIKPIAGKPLCYWVCRAAAHAKTIDEVYVSTEDEKIKRTVLSFGLNVKVIDRPKRLATDTASTEAVMLHFMNSVAFDILVTIQATSPLTQGRDLDNALKLFNATRLDSLVTGVGTKRFYWSLNGRPLNYDFKKRPRRQEFAGSIMENGAFYITKKKILKKFKNRLGDKIGVYQMTSAHAREIDETEDFAFIEKILKMREVKTKNNLKKIKIIFTDFDGVWTDNTVSTDARGNETVRCSKEDSLGLAIFRRTTRIPVIVISKERNPIVEKRCQKLNLPLVLAADDKVSAVSAILKKRGMHWNNAGYVGNDVNDLPPIKKTGVSAAPADAVTAVKERVDYILSRNGGNGAMREFFNLFI